MPDNRVKNKLDVKMRNGIPKKKKKIDILVVVKEMPLKFRIYSEITISMEYSQKENKIV